MDSTRSERGLVFVLFGAAGDLAQRLIVPALFRLHQQQRLPERFAVLGVDRKEQSVAELARHYRSRAVQINSGSGIQAWDEFVGRLAYLELDALDPSGYAQLAERLHGYDATWHERAVHVFYLATPPALFAPIARGLRATHLARDHHRARVVVEKPLGHDVTSFRDTDRALRDAFEEAQIYRIDHFLGKETVQNILALRFANPIFEPIWNRRYVDHVAITVAETLGVEHRAGYYERAGALRDMIQNHLLQLLCLVAMEPPVAYSADDIRDRKLDVLRAVRPLKADRLAEVAARGQYGEGWLQGKRVRGYRKEEGVNPNSAIETYAALKIDVDTWRWQDVPFYLRTGKRMAADVSEISVRFRDVPHRAFPARAGLDSQPARLVIQIQPEQGVVLKFMAKEPGYRLRLRPVDMRFSYAEAFNRLGPHAYETLLHDVLAGDATLFMRGDEVEAAWLLLDPVLETWRENPPTEFPNYVAGSWGPESAEQLPACDGRSWLTPTLTTTVNERQWDKSA